MRQLSPLLQRCATCGCIILPNTEVPCKACQACRYCSPECRSSNRFHAPGGVECRRIWPLVVPLELVLAVRVLRRQLEVWAQGQAAYTHKPAAPCFSVRVGTVPRLAALPMHCSFQPEPLETACLKYHVLQEPGTAADHVSSLEDHMADWLQQEHSAGLLQLAVMAALVAVAASACGPPAAEGLTGFRAGDLLRLVLVVDINAVAGRYTGSYFAQQCACLLPAAREQSKCWR